ncbi:hypothetical protein D3C72_1772010 [compost metagenome]
MVSIRHHLVSPLCSRFTPTNAVKASHHWLAKTGLPGMPNARESRMKVPATKRTICQVVMMNSLLRNDRNWG